jgi:hypothetical protein
MCALDGVMWRKFFPDHIERSSRTGLSDCMISKDFSDRLYQKKLLLFWER